MPSSLPQKENPENPEIDNKRVSLPTEEHVLLSEQARQESDVPSGDAASPRHEDPLPSEAVRETLFESEGRPGESVTATAVIKTTIPAQPPTVLMDATAIAALQDADSQVAQLVQVALAKGVPHALAVVKKLDLYVVDKLHDELSEKFYDELIARGLVPKK